jgi:hypothetical protein
VFYQYIKQWVKLQFCILQLLVFFRKIKDSRLDVICMFLKINKLFVLRNVFFCWFYLQVGCNDILWLIAISLNINLLLEVAELSHRALTPATDLFTSLGRQMSGRFIGP